MTEIEPIETAMNEIIDEPPPASTRQRSLMLLITAVVIILDQVSKGLVEISLPLNRSWNPIPVLAPFFRFSHVANTGTAFGLFPTGSLFFTWVTVFVSGAIVYYNYKLPVGYRAFRIALGLQLGGALGNLVDRMRLGHVTDFLDFGPWPVFNLADLSIVAGAILLGWIVLKEQRQELARARPPANIPGGHTEARIEPGALDERPAN